MDPKLVLFLVLGAIATSGTEFECYSVNYFATRCYRFSFGEECQPWQLDQCTPYKITLYDPVCPRYFCVRLL